MKLVRIIFWLIALAVLAWLIWCGLNEYLDPIEIIELERR